MAWRFQLLLGREDQRSQRPSALKTVVNSFLREGATWRHARRGGSGLSSPRYDKSSGTALSR